MFGNGCRPKTECKSNNFFPSEQKGENLFLFLCWKNILFQPVFSLKKSRYLLELIPDKCESTFFF